MVKQPQDRRDTYNAQGTNKDIRRRVIVRHHFRDEVCSHSDDAEKGYGLKYPANFKSRSKGAIIGSGHIWRGEVVDLEKSKEKVADVKSSGRIMNDFSQ